MNIKVINRDVEEFPTQLDRLTDAPSKLFVRGNIPPIQWVAIVGTRKADGRMLRFTTELSFQLARLNMGIISGGALGVDTAAHQGALDAGGKTIAVLGSGFDFIFPKKNEQLFKEISLNGAVITEYPHNTPPARWTFPKRNRLVAAIANAVVVVQAPERSGSMITARIARKIGVPLGAVPGVPGDELAVGCNRLIQGGAALVAGVEDVVRIIGDDSYCPQLDLPGTVKQGMGSTKKTPPNLTSVEQRIWEQLGVDAMHINNIALNTQLPMQQVSAALLTMELSGYVGDLGGRRFVRT